MTPWFHVVRACPVIFLIPTLLYGYRTHLPVPRSTYLFTRQFSQLLVCRKTETENTILL
jgi:hypothetical protein